MTDDCNHVFVPTSGGEPRFRKNSQMWEGYRAHVTCIKCGVRTWMTEEEWYSLPVAEDGD